MTRNTASEGPAAGVSIGASHDNDARPKKAQPRSMSSVKKEMPKTILGLFQYVYGEPERKLTITQRTIREMPLQPHSAQMEVEAVRRLSTNDPFVAVPPSLLAAVAEAGADRRVRERILDLIVEALDCHAVFSGWYKSWCSGVQTEAPVEQITDAVRKVKFHELGLQTASSLTVTARDRLRANALTTVSLVSFLRGGSLEKFIDDMSKYVWEVSKDRNDAYVAAVLVSARNDEALHYLSQRFATHVQNCEAGRDRALAQAREQELRAIRSEAACQRLHDDLDSERNHSAQLAAEVDDLRRRLAAEQSSRVVDRSHHVDDYEILRTQVIRRLAGQVELLNDGLHALRNGSAVVAEEFVERALSAILGEVKRLKEIDGESA